MISSLLAWPGSALVYDPKRELYAQTAAHRSRFSGTFYFDPACPHSARFNPLWEIRAGTVHEIGDVQNVVSILIDPSGTKNSYDYWDSDAAKMLTGLILYALRELPREQQHLATINDMLLDIKDTLEAMAACRHPRVKAIAEYLLGLPDKQFGGVHGSASTALILYDDPIVARNIQMQRLPHLRPGVQRSSDDLLPAGPADRRGAAAAADPADPDASGAGADVRHRRRRRRPHEAAPAALPAGGVPEPRPAGLLLRRRCG